MCDEFDHVSAKNVAKKAKRTISTLTAAQHGASAAKFQPYTSKFISNMYDSYHTYDYLIEKVDTYPKLETILSIEDQKTLIELDTMNILLFRDYLGDEILKYISNDSLFILFLYKQLDDIDEKYIMNNIEKHPSSIQFIYITPNKYQDNELLKELAVKKDGSVLKFIKEPSDNIINLAIEQSFSSIFFVDEPSRKLQCKAIKSGLEKSHDLKYFLRRLTLTDEIFEDNSVLLELDDDIVYTYFKVFFDYIHYEEDYKEKKKITDSLGSLSNIIDGIFYLPTVNVCLSLDFINKDKRLKQLYKLAKMELKLKK